MQIKSWMLGWVLGAKIIEAFHRMLEKRAESHDGANEIPNGEADHAGTRFSSALSRLSWRAAEFSERNRDALREIRAKYVIEKDRTQLSFCQLSSLIHQRRPEIHWQDRKKNKQKILYRHISIRSAASGASISFVFQAKSLSQDESYFCALRSSGPSSERVHLSKYHLARELQHFRAPNSSFKIARKAKGYFSAFPRSQKQITTLTTNVIRGTIKAEC